jgi:hypothetical protein
VFSFMYGHFQNLLHQYIVRAIVYPLVVLLELQDPDSLILRR